MKVLVADDDRAIRESLTTALELNGYQVRACSDGVEALAAYREDRPDVVVLDVMMPGVDGLGVCRVLRAEGDRVPILMLTARVETADRVAGLDAGADDYVPKPYDVEEVLARLRALLRRVEPGGPKDDLVVEDVRLSSTSRRVWRRDREIELSKTEFDLLELLMLNAGIVLEHHVIYERIWGYDFGPDSKNLAVYVGYLRRKLGAPELIRTVRGVGYTMRAT
ncbi:MAG: response regulator transcription factor [Candidatus Nanopelagicales bacterium]